MTPRWLTAALLAIALGVLGACSATPTLPLPPPFVDQVSAPNAEGFVIVEGEAKAMAAMFLYNEDLDEGVIGRADEEGVFVLVVRGRSGDTLTLWQETGSDEGQRVTRIVPEP